MSNLYYTALWPLENLTNYCNQNGIYIGTSTASYRKFQCYLDYSFGGFYSGNYNNIQTGVNLQLDGYVKLQVGANMVRGHLPGFI